MKGSRMLRAGEGCLIDGTSASAGRVSASNVSNIARISVRCSFFVRGCCCFCVFFGPVCLGTALNDSGEVVVFTIFLTTVASIVEVTDPYKAQFLVGGRTTGGQCLFFVRESPVVCPEPADREFIILVFWDLFKSYFAAVHYSSSSLK